MKRSLFCMLCIMLCNIPDTVAIQKNPTKKQMSPNLNFYTYYFMIKEYYNLFTTPEFLKNHRKMDNAKIICSQCNYSMTASKLWAYSVVYTREPLLQELLSIFYNGTTEELTLFTLTQHQKYQIDCSHCGDYHGYYIQEEESSAQE